MHQDLLCSTFRFHASYLNNPTCEGREAGYIYIHGGPYNADEELREQFEEVIGEEPIMALVDELSNMGHE